MTPIASSSACIGVPTCQMGILESQKALRNIIGYFNEKGKYFDVLPPIYISGCGNSCGAHQIGGIGLTGKKGKVGDVLKGIFEVYMNGCCKEDETRLGDYMGDVAEEYVGECFYQLAEKVIASGMNFKQYVTKHAEDIKGHLKNYLK